MAVSKKKGSVPTWQMSWKGFFIAASVALNVAFVVLFITMATTSALDGMYINEGLKRYCSATNDNLFAASADQVKALRDFTCAKGEAKQPFEDAFNAYMHSKGIEHTH